MLDLSNSLACSPARMATGPRLFVVFIIGLVLRMGVRGVVWVGGRAGEFFHTSFPTCGLDAARPALFF